MEKIQKLNTLAQQQLIENILPFWDHAIDGEHGGLFAGIDRKGRVIDTDKAVWLQGRYVWTLGKTYQKVHPEAEYLRKAEQVLSFIENHCFDEDGRMFFRVTAEGRGLIKRKRYLFSECFAVLGYAAHSQAAESEKSLEKAKALFALIEKYRDTPGLLEPKINPQVRLTRGFALPMILLVVLQELREADPAGASEYNRKIDLLITELNGFVLYDRQAVMEQILPDGSVLNTFEGRTMNPGHAIEAAWFILKEARIRRNASYQKLGMDMLTWMWERGWDEEYGGFFYFRDIDGHPSPEYWHDMKFWWPHNEAVIAALSAYELTGEEEWLNRGLEVLDYCGTHFADPEQGEWYGYLHRDGGISSDLKGTYFKGPFHVPRMYIIMKEITERILAHGK